MTAHNNIEGFSLLTALLQVLLGGSELFQTPSNIPPLDPKPKSENPLSQVSNVAFVILDDLKDAAVIAKALAEANDG